MKKVYQNIKKIAFKSLLLSGITLTALSPAFSQVPDVEWQKALGGTRREVANSIRQTADGGYIIAGTTESNNGDALPGTKGDGDVWIVKLKSSGELDWQKTYGGTGFDEAKSIRQTKDGGYIFAGSTTSSDGDVTGNHNTDGIFADFWVMLLKANGEFTWKRCFGGAGDDKASSVMETADGGFIVAGYTYSNDGNVTNNHVSDESTADFWVLKLNNGGNLNTTMQKTFGGTGEDKATSIIQTADGGYIVTGDSKSTDGDVTDNHGSSDCWVVKLTSALAIDWKKSYGGSLVDYGNCIRQIADGYIIAGTSFSTDKDLVGAGNHGSGDCWVLKINGTGVLGLKKAYGGSSADQAYSIEATTDGGYILGAYTASNDGDVENENLGGDVWALKIKSDLTIDWQKPMGGTLPETGYDALQTSDGGYIVAGQALSTNGYLANAGNHGGGDAWVVKLRSIVTPLDLLSFNAAKQSSKVLLTWQTANEENTLDFLIERSSDGIAFAPIVKVPALGSSSAEHTYTASDDLPLSGANYYRLRSRDKDGQYTFSGIIRLAFEKDGSIALRPNPVKNVMNIFWQNSAGKNAMVQVTDLAGKVVLNKKILLQQGENIIPVSVQHLPTGTYMAKMMAGNEVKVIKFVKE